ncbi:MAG: DMT family transporter [Roseburia sp.]
MKKETRTENFMQKTWVVWLGALICCALWGSAFPCIKLGYQYFAIDSSETATQILFAGCRFFLAGIMAILLGSLLQKKILIPRKSAWGKICHLSLLQTVAQYFFFYVGLAHTSGVKASIIEGVNVFIAILVASLLFRQEPFTLRKIVGCVIGFAGVVLVNISGSGLEAGFAWNGEGFIFLSTIAYAFSSVYLKRYSKEENPVLLSGYQFVIGGLIMIIVGFLMGGTITTVTAKGIAMLLYLAFISAAAYSLWGILLKYNPVSRVAVFGFMNPVFGVILSAVLLKESGTIGVMCVVSLLLVCAGIYIVNKAESNMKE